MVTHHTKLFQQFRDDSEILQTEERKPRCWFRHTTCANCISAFKMQKYGMARGLTDQQSDKPEIRTMTNNAKTTLNEDTLLSMFCTGSWCPIRCFLFRLHILLVGHDGCTSACPFDSLDIKTKSFITVTSRGRGGVESRSFLGRCFKAII